MRPLRERIAALRKKYAGTPVTATEPVFDYMADAPRAQDAQRTLSARGDERHRAQRGGRSRPSKGTCERDAVKVLLYNTQTSQALAERMRTIATEAGVPVVAITETEPAGKTYQAVDALAARCARSRARRMSVQARMSGTRSSSTG